MLGVDRVFRAVHDVVVDPVLHEGGLVLAAPQPLRVGLVLREQQLRRAFAGERQPAVVLAVDVDRPAARLRLGLPQALAARPQAPGPRVAKPDRREQVQRGLLGPAVEGVDADQDVVGPRLRVLREDVEVPVVVEDAGVHQLELGVAPLAATVLLEQPRVRVFALRVLVERLHVGVRGRRIQVVVGLLDVFAVVALRAGQAEEPLLQDRIPAVPERDGEADVLVAVGDAHQPVFAPAVRARARMVVRERVPGRAVPAVVLANRSPLRAPRGTAPSASSSFAAAASSARRRRSGSETGPACR